MTDNTGQTVMSALNEDMCKQIAAAGGGAYIHVENNSNAQDLLDQELDKLSKKETQSTIYSDYDEQFQAFGILALLLLIIEICLLEQEPARQAYLVVWCQEESRSHRRAADGGHECECSDRQALCASGQQAVP